ncbi:MAG: PIG-L deacetylase family protein [Actinomycetota bacterium]
MSTFRALAVTAHPDDAEFGCAGTLARWADEGAEVTLCIVTDGSTGTQEADVAGAELAAIRREETERAADIIGASGVVWLGYRDGYVEYTLDLRRDIARVFRRVRPHRYIVMDPSPTVDDWFINHPDHRAVGQASLDVTLSAGTTPGHFPELLDEGLQPWRGLREAWMMGPASAPVVVDISKTIDRKIDALMCHASQLGDDRDRIDEWVRGWTAEIGKPKGYDHAESFKVFSRGPGFHEGETDDVELDLAEPAVDPRA